MRYKVHRFFYEKLFRCFFGKDSPAFYLHCWPPISVILSLSKDLSAQCFSPENWKQDDINKKGFPLQWKVASSNLFQVFPKDSTILITKCYPSDIFIANFRGFFI